MKNSLTDKYMDRHEGLNSDLDFSFELIMLLWPSHWLWPWEHTASLTSTALHAICFISNHLKIGTIGISKIQPVQLLRWFLNFLKEFIRDLIFLNIEALFPEKKYLGSKNLHEISYFEQKFQTLTYVYNEGVQSNFFSERPYSCLTFWRINWLVAYESLKNQPLVK